MDNYRVVFHIDEGSIARANMVLHNIQNLIDDSRFFPAPSPRLEGGLAQDRARQHA
jgi:intracellular sulfur oxidation DsrE/DsrF family protein